VIGPVLPPQHDPNKRAELLRRIEGLHPVAKLDGAQFVAGARLRLRRGVDQAAAMRFVAELQAVGAHAELEANRPPDEAILALDQVADAGPEPDRVAALNEQMMAQLQSLDGDEPARASSPPVEPPTEPVAPADDARFRPSGDWHQPMDLELEVPVRPAAPPPPAPIAGDPDEEDDENLAIPVATAKPIPRNVFGRAEDEITSDFALPGAEGRRPRASEPPAESGSPAPAAPVQVWQPLSDDEATGEALLSSLKRTENAPDGEPGPGRPGLN